jgi:hypothetical protein
VQVRLGRQQIDARFERFMLVAAKLVSQRAADIAYVDMRYSNGFAVGWKGSGGHLAQRDRGPKGRTSMVKKADKDVIVGLDIGTSKVLALVGEITADGSIEVIGMGSQPSRGLKKGVVVNIESTVQSIQRAVEEAELMADCEINAVYAGIAGSHVRSLNSHGVVAIRDREVTYGDVEHVIDAAKAVAIPADQRILHVLPQEVSDRRTGRYPRSDRHVGRAARGQGAHRHGRRQCRAEYHQVRAALRSGGRGRGARAACLEFRGADR